MKTSYKILIGVGAVVLLYVLWELYCAWQDGKTDEPDIDDTDTPDSGTDTAATTPKAAATSTSTSIVVKYGSKNSKVGQLQTLLNNAGYSKSAIGENLAVDNIYGTKTNKVLAWLDSKSWLVTTSMKNACYTKSGDSFTFTATQFDNTCSLLKKAKTNTTLTNTVTSDPKKDGSSFWGLIAGAMTSK